MKETRINNEKSQKEVADRLRISQQQYSLYENGKRYIPVDLLKDFCELMDCSADYILGIERREKSKPISKADCTKYTFLYKSKKELHHACSISVTLFIILLLRPT